MLAISGAAQESALNYARAKGIGIIRLLPDDQVRTVLYQMPQSMIYEPPKLHPEEFREALTHANFVGFNREFYAQVGDYIYGDWQSVLHAMLERE